ncbi:hypothetical protein BKI52_22470 [marine bacterium AO1-C]|nr:hypothetical protein BKI52_22470 [marine bacterium AO1-C]
MKTIQNFQDQQITQNQLTQIKGGGGSRRQELDHVGAYNFMVEISGVAAGYFKGVDGLNAEIEVIEFQDGDDLF